MFCFLFFFFQAEDGIRDHCVTGVQTCALPISREFKRDTWTYRLKKCRSSECATMCWLPCSHWPTKNHCVHRPNARRSEERRVGKECRSRWARYHEKKKKKRMRVYAWVILVVFK